MEQETRGSEYKVIEAFGLTTRTWTYSENYGYGCAECCTGDRCDGDCDSKYKRKDCPHCRGKGWIKPSDVTNDFLTGTELTQLK